MTQEEKDLLLKDLCARLPYGVKVQIKKNEIVTLDSVCNDDGYYFNFIGNDKEGVNIEQIKPYLLPLSSMTESQKLEYRKTQWIYQADYCAPQYFDGIESFDWCYKNNFDCRGLIPKNLAIDATGLNIY